MGSDTVGSDLRAAYGAVTSTETSSQHSHVLLRIANVLHILILADLRDTCKLYRCRVRGKKKVLVERCLDLVLAWLRCGEWSTVASFCRHVKKLYEARICGTRANLVVPRVLLPKLCEKSPSGADCPRFVESPFYDKLAMVYNCDLFATNESTTVEVDVQLNVRHLQWLRTTPERYRLLLFCGNATSIMGASFKMAFPDGTLLQSRIVRTSEAVRIDLSGDVLGPIDITPAVMVQDQPECTKLKMQYTAQQLKFCAVFVVKCTTVSAPVSRICPPAMEDQCGDQSRFTISLIDPVAGQRLLVPIRSVDCSHRQCFDAFTYLSTHQIRPTWLCPVCAKSITFSSLVLDLPVKGVVDELPDFVSWVTISANEWWIAGTSNGATLSRHHLEQTSYAQSERDHHSLACCMSSGAPPSLQASEAPAELACEPDTQLCASIAESPLTLNRMGSF